MVDVDVDVDIDAFGGDGGEQPFFNEKEKDLTE